MFHSKQHQQNPLHASHNNPYPIGTRGWSTGSATLLVPAGTSTALEAGAYSATRKRVTCAHHETRVPDIDGPESLSSNPELPSPRARRCRELAFRDLQKQGFLVAEYAPAASAVGRRRRHRRCGRQVDPVGLLHGATGWARLSYPCWGLARLKPSLLELAGVRASRKVVTSVFAGEGEHINRNSSCSGVWPRLQRSRRPLGHRT